VHITGPATFSLWPGQIAEVIKGHQLRSNEFLLVRVYDGEKAKKNWEQAVIKPQIVPVDVPFQKEEQKADKDNVGDKPEKTEDKIVNLEGVIRAGDKAPEYLITGQLLIVKGTDVSFFIPPTGIEVVKEEQGNYVRGAVTLEQLEYCILVDQNGSKRYERGPAVVFPSPTETFVMDKGKTTRKFRAIELQQHWGLHIKVIAPYKDGDREYKEGEELFITGKEQQIYFPRPEHAIIEYSGERIHYGIAIPEGEARYVLDRINGANKLVIGPKMFLPDPRKELIIRRILDDRIISLWYPENTEALRYNQQLRAVTPEDKDYIAEPALSAIRGISFKKEITSFATENVSGEFRGDEFSRRNKFTEPRTIVLDTKYKGAVEIDVWTGYAVQIVSKTGKRRVVVGPSHILLEYGETLEILELSTETPKNHDKLIRTVFLRVNNNKVSDKVTVETQDLVNVDIILSYRVNFEGNNEKWFGVENYVRLLTDHIRSLLRNVVKQKGIEAFYSNAINIIRDAILGVAKEGDKRPGRVFTENGMRIYDVEVLKLTIADEKVSKLLAEAQLDSVSLAVNLGKKQREAESTKKTEEFQQEIIKAKDATTALQSANLLEAEKRNADIAEAKEATTDIGHSARLARLRSEEEQEILAIRGKLELFIKKLDAQTQAAVKQGEAVSPHLISSIVRLADDSTMQEIAKELGQVTLFSGKSPQEIIAMIASGSQIGERLKELIPFIIGKPKSGDSAVDKLDKDVEEGLEQK
jgi:major vault protein